MIDRKFVARIGVTGCILVAEIAPPPPPQKKENEEVKYVDITRHVWPSYVHHANNLRGN